MKRTKIERMILTTLTSAASGALIGILFAPDKGSKTRKKLSRKGDELLNEITSDIKEIRKYMNKQAEEAKEGIEELSQETKEAGQKAKEKGEEILDSAEDLTSYTKEELFEKAKEAQINGYSKMNKDELVDVLKKDIL